MKINSFIIVLFLGIFCSCSDHSTDRQKRLAECVDSFSTSYFNYQFEQARRFVTPDSEKWLQLAASNVMKEDIDVLLQQEQGATIEIEDFQMSDADSVATVRVKVNHYLPLHKIGIPAVIRDEDIFHLNAVESNGIWKIRMATLPRSEKRSHD